MHSGKPPPAVLWPRHLPLARRDPVGRIQPPDSNSVALMMPATRERFGIQGLMRLQSAPDLGCLDGFGGIDS